MVRRRRPGRLQSRLRTPRAPPEAPFSRSSSSFLLLLRARLLLAGDGIAKQSCGQRVELGGQLEQVETGDGALGARLLRQPARPRAMPIDVELRGLLRRLAAH